MPYFKVLREKIAGVRTYLDPPARDDANLREDARTFEEVMRAFAGEVADILEDLAGKVEVDRGKIEDSVSS